MTIPIAPDSSAPGVAILFLTLAISGIFCGFKLNFPIANDLTTFSNVNYLCEYALSEVPIQGLCACAQPLTSG